MQSARLEKQGYYSARFIHKVHYIMTEKEVDMISNPGSFYEFSERNGKIPKKELVAKYTGALAAFYSKVSASLVKPSLTEEDLALQRMLSKNQQASISLEAQPGTVY